MYSVEKTKGINYWKQFDYLLFLVILLMTGIGLAVLHSATRLMAAGIDGNKIFRLQVISIIVGIVIAVVVSLLDYKDFKALSAIFYIISVVMLIYVKFRGIEINGSKSWINLPGIGTLQPSELAKIAFILYISIFLERIKDGQKNFNSNLVKLIVYSAIPTGLVLLQPDYGTAMVFMFIFAVMVYIAELPYKYFLFTAGGVLVTTPFIWFFVLQEYQKDRIRTFLNPGSSLQGAGYQVDRTTTAIGSGQLYGKGLYKGIQTQNKGIPVKESDSIFAVLGEELGFIVCMLFLLLVVFILLRCIYIAKNSRDSYGSFIITGILSMFAFHFIENIGMNIGLLPVTGIPLPFVSAGRSAMVTNFIAAGIVLSVSMRRKKVIFNNSE